MRKEKCIIWTKLVPEYTAGSIKSPTQIGISRYSLVLYHELDKTW